MRRALDFRSALPILRQARMNIPITFQESHAQVCALIADFREREAFYLSVEYQEAEARQDFIDKFWIALGWDVRHDRQKNPYEQEVKVERGVSVVTGLAQKKADYAFFLGPEYRIPRFFCEAKKPSVKIREDRDAHFQTHRYGYSAKTKLSVLFDFEELVIVDCRRKPNVDFALTAAHRSYCYEDFEDEAKFGEIYWLFSREAVGDGKLDAYVAAMPKVKKTGKQAGAQRGSDSQTVDDSFLDDLERYRSELARMLKNRNAELDGDTLTELVQRILDRLVFLRFLEDKLIETEHSVHEFTKTAEGQGWARFLTVSRKLDARYNGVVFKEHPLLDGGTLTVDDGDFLAICKELSHERTPYDFNAIPVHILGSIYERFLGTVITTTDKRAKPELKPEVRKAGGVYYTPEYIVRYICEQTVGKLIEGKTPVQIEKMRFADIACGSGSFLLGIFDLLLRYHGRWYAAHTEAAGKENLAPATKNRKRKKEFIPAVVEREGLLCLTLEKKRQILLNNIYGVDLDTQAVEVAQLSLYLKLLEDETTASTRDDYLAFHEALLPPLGGNIKCGNSLVGTDILYGQFEFSAQEERKLRPMDFESAFPQVFGAKWSGTDRVKDDADGSHVDVGPEPQRETVDYSERKPVKEEKPKAQPLNGGFDAIVGNPPYVRQEALGFIKQYLSTHYESYESTADLFTYFMERSVRELVREGGRFAYIVSSSFLRTAYGEKLRSALKRHATIERIVDFGGLPVFESAKDTYVCIPILSKTPQAQRVEIARVESLKQTDWSAALSKCDYTIPHSRLSARAWSLDTDAQDALFTKVMKTGKALGQYLGGKMFYGIKTGLNEAFVITDEKRNALARNAATAPLIHPVVGGENIRRYFIESDGEHLIVMPSGWTRARMTEAGLTARRESEAWAWLESKHPSLAAHLAPFEAACRKREDQGDYWWELRPCDYYGSLEEPKIVFPDICKGPRFSFDRSGTYLKNTAYCLGSDSLYLLAVLNSRLFWFTIARLSIPFGIRAGEFRYRLIYQYMEHVPIRVLDLAIPAQKAQHDRMVQLVEQMLKTKAQISTAKTESDRTYLEDKCAGLDRQIDQLTYELYDLTPEEVALVEQGK